jgi:hypothetical protein
MGRICTPLRLYNNRSCLVERAKQQVTARLASRALKAYYDAE